MPVSLWNCDYVLNASFQNVLAMNIQWNIYYVSYNIICTAWKQNIWAAGEPASCQCLTTVVTILLIQLLFFQLFIDNSFLPDVWRQAYRPVLKKGDATHVCNYRLFLSRGTNSLSVLMCRKAVNQSINQSTMVNRLLILFMLISVRRLTAWFTKLVNINFKLFV